MTTHSTVQRIARILFCAALAAVSVTVPAQNTTSAVGGKVTSADGRAVPGAAVNIRHVESGSVANVSTDSEGRYIARGLRV
jgi:hypothetical protein